MCFCLFLDKYLFTIILYLKNMSNIVTLINYNFHYFRLYFFDIILTSHHVTIYIKFLFCFSFFFI